MKVLLIATTFPRNIDDSIPQFVFGLARALVQENAQVTVIAPHDKHTKDYEVYDGVHVRRIQYWYPKNAQGLCYGAGIPTNIRRKKWLALQFPILEAAFFQAVLRYGQDADVVNPHWTFASFPAVLAAKILRKPIVLHAYSAEFIPQILNPLNRFVINNAQATISISQYTANIVESLVQPKHHHTIGFGVNPEKIAPPNFDDALLREKHAIFPATTLVLAIGRLVERKGYHVIVDAIASLVNQGEDIYLIHCGKGPQRDNLLTQIKQLGIEDHVELLGFVPDKNLKKYLKAADILVMPSIVDQTQDTEGLGIPLLEAMANQTPVIGSDIGGITSIIQHEYNGLLVPPNDAEALAAAIKRLRITPSLRARLIKNGLHTTETTYSWKTIAHQTLQVFEDSQKDSQF